MERQGLKSFLEFYENFQIEDPSAFNAVYDEAVKFVDPFHEVHGRENLYAYFVKLMERVSDCRFEISNVVEKESLAVVIWKMKFTHKLLNKGNEVIVDGVTHLEFSERVYYHRDYFDSSQLIYKNLPVIGSMVKLIESRM